MNPFGSVAVQVRPPSNVAFTAQPSLKFQSLAPVIQLLGLSGFRASGVSFCAVVSWLTSTTSCTCGERVLTAAKLGALVAAGGGGGVGGSLQATNATAATESATRTMLDMGPSRRGEDANMTPVSRARKIVWPYQSVTVRVRYGHTAHTAL